jgi:hypothetical protein
MKGVPCALQRISDSREGPVRFKGQGNRLFKRKPNQAGIFNPAVFGKSRTGGHAYQDGGGQGEKDPCFQSHVHYTQKTYTSNRLMIA